MRVFPVLLAIGVLMLVAPARAQTTSTVNAGIQFDFALPGARSLAMGGAFVALADDATAAQANPAGLAGLVGLINSEVAVEGRGWNFFTWTPDRGHAFGSPTGIGVDSVIASDRWPHLGAEFADVAGRELKDHTNSASLISFVHAGATWAIAGYRHQLLNLVNRTITNGPFFTLANGEVYRVNPVTGRIEADIAAYGVSVGRLVGDRLSVGGGVSLSTFSIASRAQSFAVAPSASVPANQRAAFVNSGETFGPADFSDSKVLFVDEQFGDDTAWGYNLGVLLTVGKLEMPRWWQRGKIAAAFRKGPTFHYDTRFATGPALSPGIERGQVISTHQDVPFHVPDSLAVGFAFPGDALKLSVEYAYIRYRQLIDGSGTGLPLETAGQSESADPKVREDGLREVAALRIDNPNQVRAGLEWRAAESTTQQNQLFLRAGIWYDPDHRVRSELTGVNDPRISAKAVLLPRGPDEVHYSFGVGGLLSGRVQIDAGVDLSPRVNTFAASTVVYIGKTLNVTSSASRATASTRR